jgi:hypothetical protein
MNTLVTPTTTALLCCVWLLQFIPFLVPPCIYARLDPFYYVFRLFMPNPNLIITLLIGLLRLFLSFCCTVLAIRHISLTMLMGFVYYRRTQEYLNTLVPKKLGKYAKFHAPRWSWIMGLQTVFEYRVFYSFFTFFAQDFLNNISCGLVAMALCAGITSNFVIIRMINLMPSIIYIGILGIGVMISIVSSVLFPFLAGVLKSSYKVHRQWILQANAFPSNRRKLFVREIRSLLPCGVKLSLGTYNFITFDSTITVAFLRRYFEYTVNLCLSVNF